MVQFRKKSLKQGNRKWDNRTFILKLHANCTLKTLKIFHNKVFFIIFLKKRYNNNKGNNTFMKISFINIFENNELISLFVPRYIKSTYMLIYKKEQAFVRNRKKEARILKSIISASISQFYKWDLFYYLKETIDIISK